MEASLGLGQGGDELLPPGVGVLVGAKDAGVLGAVDAGRFLAASRGAGLLVAGYVGATVGAARADVALDEILAGVLVNADALSMEPFLAPVAADHEAMVVRAAADAVRAAVGLAGALFPGRGVVGPRRGLFILAEPRLGDFILFGCGRTGLLSSAGARLAFLGRLHDACRALLLLAACCGS